MMGLELNEIHLYENFVKHLTKLIGAGGGGRGGGGCN